MAQQSAGRALAMGSLAGTVSYVWSHFLWPWLVPAGAPVVTILLGWAQGLPLMHIWIGALVAFAAATHGILRLDEWRARRRVEYKLTFGQGRFLKHISGGSYGLGVLVNNQADFPIEFEVVELDTQIDNRVPARTPGPRPVRRIRVDAGGLGWWDDTTIPLTPPRPGTIIGQLAFKLRYGHPGALRYELSGRKQCAVHFDAAGQPGAVVWTDLVN